MLFCANPFQPNIAFNVETNHLILSPNQMTGFYMEFNTGLKWVNIDKGILSEKDFVYPLGASTTEWSNTLKQFVGFCRRIVWVCLTLLWDWRLKG